MSGLALCSTTCVRADDYPTKPVKIVIANAAGGASDVLVRLMTPQLSESLRQPVVIENRPGAGANIGAEIAARSPADGYTLFLASAPHAIAPSLYKSPRKLRSLAVTALKRSPLLPTVPTLAESGYPGYELVNWFGYLVPAATPDDIIRRLNVALTRIAESAEFRNRLAVLGAEPRTATPEEMRAFITGEVTKWGKIVRATGARRMTEFVDAHECPTFKPGSVHSLTAIGSRTGLPSAGDVTQYRPVPAPTHISLRSHSTNTASVSRG